MSESISVKPGLPSSEVEIASADQKDLDKIQTWEENTAVGKFTRDHLERLGQVVLGIKVSGEPKREMVRRIKAHLDLDHRREGLATDSRYQEAPEPASQEFTATSNHQFAIRCVRCGEIAVELQPGFNPSRSENTPFHRWPLRFVGPPHLSESELKNRSRENPTCPSCESDLPMRANNTQVLGRAIQVLDQ